MRRHRGLEPHPPHGCLLIQPSEVNTGPGEATGPRETPLECRQIPPSAPRWVNETHLLCKTFVEVELGMLGDFTFRSEINNTPQQTGWCHDWCDHGGVANICRFAVACAPTDVRTKARTTKIISSCIIQNTFLSTPSVP